jgi:spore coat polysaccharide biosynthesis predicted glycosyltransferase SpsG
MRAFDGLDLHVEAVVGPGFSDAQERAVRDAAAAVSTDVTVVCDPADLPDRMFRADFAVSTAGTTTYELLALGTPIVSVPVVDNQRPIANALRDRGLAAVVERCDDASPLRMAIETYVNDPDIRRERRSRGRRLIDGRGTERVADVVENCVTVR